MKLEVIGAKYGLGEIQMNAKYRSKIWKEKDETESNRRKEAGYLKRGKVWIGAPQHNTTEPPT